LGNNAIVFFSGMPSDAAGPVADTVTPILMSANACVLIDTDALVTSMAAEIQRNANFIALAS